MRPGQTILLVRMKTFPRKFHCNFFIFTDFLVQQYEQIESAVVCEQFDNNFTNELTSMLKLLMECGAKFDNQPRCRGLMDTAFTLFRNLLRKFRRKLPDSVNLLLLKVIELRAGRWMMKEGIEEYYRNKRMAGNHQRGNNNRSHSTYASRHSSPVAFRSSGLRTSKSYGDVTSSGAEDFRPYHGMSSFVKNCCKDEVIIKNSDSGKVMGIKGRRVHMIEEMSDTIISFQKGLPCSIRSCCFLTCYLCPNSFGDGQRPSRVDLRP